MKQCLVVDDSRIMRKIARVIFESLDFAVEEAEDGVAALNLCRRKMPDAVFLDGNLPNKSGLEFMRAVRREASSGKPLMLVSLIENDIGQISEAVEAGADDYVLKPYDPDTVRAKFAESGLI
jgi:two-component system, chemotaxis family, chemotaxis protein CheY